MDEAKERQLEEAFLNDGMIGAASDGVPELDNSWPKDILPLDETKKKMYQGQEKLTGIVNNLIQDDPAYAEALVEVSDAINAGINFLEHIEKTIKEISILLKEHHDV